ncbi:unnamed protein product [Amaranthus hypochondriacus]
MAAALFAVEFAIKLGFRLAHIEGDVLSVIMAIDKGSEGCSPIHLLLDKLLSSAAVLDGFVCSFVPRSGNTIAHSIARWNTGYANEKICMEPLPQELLALVDFD